MSSSFRDFDAEISTATPTGETEPVTFKLDGFTFECVNPIPLGSILVMIRKAAAAQGGPQGLGNLSGAESMDDLMAQAGIINVFWSWIIPEHHDRFDQAVSRMTDFAVFERIVEHIMTEGAGHPTQES